MSELLRPSVAASGRIAVTERLIRLLSSDRVLELGAGDYSFDYCQANGPGKKWVRVDFAEPCDLICDLNSPQVQIPLPDCFFDCIVCTEVIEHVLWPQSLLQECHRVLTSGGTLLVSVPNCVSLSYRVAWMLGRIPSCAACGNLPVGLGPTAYARENSHTIGGHVTDYDSRRLCRLLEYCGFQVDSMRGSGIFWHRQLLPPWFVPANLASNLIVTCTKRKCP